MTAWTWTRVHQTRFYRLTFGAQCSAAVVDDFGRLVIVGVQ